MRIAIERGGDGADVRAAGALDLATSGELYAALAALREDGARRIRLDVSQVDFIDSAGLSALLRWQDEAKARREEFSVWGARGLVRRVLRETGTQRLLGG